MWGRKKKEKQEGKEYFEHNVWKPIGMVSSMVFLLYVNGFGWVFFVCVCA